MDLLFAHFPLHRRRLDVNVDGTIQLSEFLAAFLDWDKIMTDEVRLASQSLSCIYMIIL